MEYIKKVVGEVPYLFLNGPLGLPTGRGYIQINLAWHHWEIHEKKSSGKLVASWGLHCNRWRTLWLMCNCWKIQAYPRHPNVTSWVELCLIGIFYVYIGGVQSLPNFRRCSPGCLGKINHWCRVKILPETNIAPSGKPWMFRCPQLLEVFRWCLGRVRECPKMTGMRKKGPGGPSKWGGNP